MTEKRRRSPGRPPTTQKNTTTDQVIIHAAIRLFLNHGYQKVSVDDVAEACGVTKATVYYYFKTKAELFTESILQMMERIRRQIDSLLHSEKPLKDRLFDVAEAHLRATMDIDLDGFLRETKNNVSENQTHMMRQAEERMYQEIEVVIEEAVNNNEIRPVSPPFAAHAFIALLRMGNAPSMQELFTAYEEMATNIINFYWRSLTNE
ncbi:AcrR family transcriptional regulator [Pullulanibacillus pueri]|uniref:TetR family transcriptional regulator n=1 Tax=Pullulanibacillus pueri TaxID=1437324 RepID=A0A8J2ZTU9_9BACL|nr:TetR/AcrR family transcriptional regulator [Pullulanibacillus pueri]MBM7681080.1 AcrR family transcriptional regulator [Pullulanibacillus pueri]GGH76969.1 TetR family transcriptional regulator [Pullulanibacillus pueri]